MNRRKFVGAALGVLGSNFISNSVFAQRRVKVKVKGKRLRVGSRKYPTISSVYSDIQPGMTIEVLPGVYNESLTLVDGVNWVFQDGAILDLDSLESNLSVVTDNGVSVTCSITGLGVFKRSQGGSRSHGVRISGNSDVSIFCKEIISATTADEAVWITNGNVNIVGNIFASDWMGVRTSNQSGNVNIVGNVSSDLDYGILSGSGMVTIRGNITSNGNSAIHCSGGSVEFEGNAISNGLFGFEMSGGTACLTNVFCKSTVDIEEESDAISKYGGEDLTLDNCTLCCVRDNAFSIGSQGNVQSGIIEVVNGLRMNRDFDSNIIVVGDDISNDPSHCF